jgi:hypothetical protein
MRLDPLALLLLNAMALTRLVPVSPALTEAAALIFLIRATMIMRVREAVVEGRRASLPESSPLPAARL